jgi:hypothetical protein
MSGREAFAFDPSLFADDAPDDIEDESVPSTDVPARTGDDDDAEVRDEGDTNNNAADDNNAPVPDEDLNMKVWEETK